MLNNTFILIAINKRLLFSLLLLKINVILLVNKIKVLSNLKELKFLLILKLIFRFFREFTMPAIFVKLIDLNSSENNASLKG